MLRAKRKSKSPYARQSSATATSGVSKQPESISTTQQPPQPLATSSSVDTCTSGTESITSIATIEPLPTPLICISDSLGAHVSQSIREKNLVEGIY